MATKKQRTVTMPVGTIDKTSFKHNIKNKKYILSSKIKSFGMEYILLRKANPKNKADIKLSDVFHFLPNGFVYKDETGMGATTLEIRAERNSIIVEPLKITASAKAYENNASTEEITELLGRGRAKKGMFEGDLVEGELEIGQVASLVTEIQPAAEIVQEIINEYKIALSEQNTDKYNF